MRIFALAVLAVGRSGAVLSRDVVAERRVP
jgi:hypothetical protein